LKRHHKEEKEDEGSSPDDIPPCHHALLSWTNTGKLMLIKNARGLGPMV
jgi:hypothetical protein